MISSILCRNILTFGQRVGFSQFRAHGHAVPLLTVFLFPITFFLSCRSSSSCCVRSSRSCCWRFASSWAWTVAFSLCSNVEEMYFTRLKAAISHRPSKSLDSLNLLPLKPPVSVAPSFVCLLVSIPEDFPHFFPSLVELLLLTVAAPGWVASFVALPWVWSRMCIEVIEHHRLLSFKM